MLYEQLISFRKSLGLSQTKVSNKIGITQQAYSLYETGINEPTLEILRKLCIVFNCTADELLEIDNPSLRAKISIND